MQNFCKEVNCEKYAYYNFENEKEEIILQTT